MRAEMDDKIGNLLRSLLNDLKRRPEDAARELGISTREMEQFLADERPFPITLVRKACSIWPVSPREFALVYDDAESGVKLMTAAESAASARVMERAGKPYYEYRDTAASSLSSFRPEWIRELCVVQDDDPENPAVQWNNGHFMHQFTYFVGPVNFYYRADDGTKRVAVMNTGDSMYIRPFVPHTFSTREAEGGNGLILALTYGGDLLGDAQQELRAVSPPLAEHYALDYASPARSVGSVIDYYLSCLAMPLAELARRTEIDATELDEQISGKRLLDDHALRRIARALNVHLRDLLTYDENVPSTIVLPATRGATWELRTANRRYRVRELASTPHVPLAKSLHFEIARGPNEGDSSDHPDSPDYGLRTGLHQYLYNVGDREVRLDWRLPGSDEGDSAVLAPDDSAYVKPFVEHGFAASEGQLISLRIPSKISGDPLRELSWLGREQIGRVADESRPWFDKRGRH